MWWIFCGLTSVTSLFIFLSYMCWICWCSAITFTEFFVCVKFGAQIFKQTQMLYVLYWLIFQVTSALISLLVFSFISSTHWLSQRIKACLCPRIHMFAFVHKMVSNLHEIWSVSTCRRVIPNTMPCDLIQGQGHETFKHSKFCLFIASVTVASGGIMCRECSCVCPCIHACISNKHW